MLPIFLGAADMVIAGYFFGIPGISVVTIAAPLSSLLGFLIMIFVSGCRIIYPEEIGRFSGLGIGTVHIGIHEGVRLRVLHRGGRDLTGECTREAARTAT